MYSASLPIRAATLVVALLFLSGFRGCLDERVGKDATVVGSPAALYNYVDTRVGTGGAFWIGAQNAPAAQVPFGRVRLGPDTATFGRILATSGYYYDDTAIVGFSHTRLLGTGVYEGGALRVLPSETSVSLENLPRQFLPFTHTHESATPGYYRVESVRRGVTVELTASERVGFHRYQFHRTTTPHLYLDLTSHLSKDGTVLAPTGNADVGTRLLTGSFQLKDDFSKRYGGLPTFFAVRLPPETTAATWLDAGHLELTLNAPMDSPILMAVAISHTSLAGAQRALDVETLNDTQTFDGARSAAEASWQSVLGTVQVETPEETDATRKFYIALMRAFSMPTRFDDPPLPGDADGRYRAFDGSTPMATGFQYYSDFSLWDTFRTAHPLYALLHPARQRDFVKSLLSMAQTSGNRLPRWAAGAGHADSMFGAPAAIVLAETAAKDPGGFDEATAYARVLDALTPGALAKGQECLAQQVQLGYCAADSVHGSVSRTLDWAWAEFAASRMATLRGDLATAATLAARAEGYRKLWDRTRLAFVPKQKDGTFLKDWAMLDSGYVPVTASGKHYVEGSANHWRWSPFIDDAGLRGLFAGAFLPELQTFFAKTSPVIGAAYPTGYYWHGNEHDIHAALHFALGGRSDLADSAVQAIRTQKYRTNSIGLDGNDDGGTLSAWYAFTAMGLYPVAGTDRYVLVAPAFSKITIDRGGGSPVIVIEHDRSIGPFACGATWNGTPLPSAEIDHTTLSAGGTLQFVASDAPCRWSSR